MKKVLVTGGAGYIGSHTVLELIRRGHKVIVVDNYENSSPDTLKTIFEGNKEMFVQQRIDIRNKEDVDFLFRSYQNIDAVIHFAAKKSVSESFEKTFNYYDTNISGLINVVEKCLEYKIPNFIFSSSATVYGDSGKSICFESQRFEYASNPYGRTKQIAEYFLQDISSNTNLKVVSLRYFNPVGCNAEGLIGENPSNIPTNIVPVICRVASGRISELKVFGKDYNTPDGTAIRDYIHVEDLADAHVASLEYFDKMDSNYEAFNVGTGNGTSVQDLITTFEDVNKVKVNHVFVERREGDLEEVVANCEKIGKEMNWFAKRNISEALKSAWNWELKQNKVKE